jgi:hypothetical protein
MAVVTLIASGCLVCSNVRKIGVCLIIGGIAIGLTQMFPIPQIVAGTVAMRIGQALGLAKMDDDDNLACVANEFGGFVITIVTGAILMTLSAGIGFLLQLVLDRWWRRPEKSSEA